MKRRIIEIIVRDFECYVCGHTEYTVLDPYSKERKIICDRCGAENHVEYEFRTTVVRELHSHNDFIKIGEWIKGAKRYFLQTFHDSGDLISNGFGSYDENEMKNLVKLLNPFVPSTKMR